MFSPSALSFFVSRRALAALTPALLTLALYACGDTASRTEDHGEPPTTVSFNPGSGAGGDGYGSSAGSSSGGDTGGTLPPPVCPDDLKRCDEEFTYPAGTEAAVELRGDFKEGAWQQGIPMTKSGGQWRVTVPVPLGRPILYKFCINPTGGQCQSWQTNSTQPTSNDGQGNVNNVRSAVTCTEPTCAEPDVPAAGVFDWRDSVIYFAFIDRFKDGDTSNNCNVPGVSGPISNYAGGDWKGLTSELDYLKGLGVNTLWLTVPADNTNQAGKGVGGDDKYYSGYHGYWPSNLEAAEGCFGTMQDLKDLVAAAHTKGMKVLFDYAMVHVHITSPTYAAHNDWFWPRFNGSQDCICGQGCDWNNDGKRCWFTDYLPHWNYNVQAARDFSVNNAVWWVKETDIDGFRLDAIKHVEDSWLTQLRSQINNDATLRVNQTPKQRFYMVGETFTYDAGALRYYIDPATKMDGQFDFPQRLETVKTLLMRQGGTTMSGFASFMANNDNQYATNVVMSTWIGNHDLGRVIHMAEDQPLWNEYQSGDKDRGWSNQPGQPTDRRPYERVANGFALIATTKGAPLIYYGDEIGLAGAGDPDNRRVMPWTGLTANQTWLRGRMSKLFAIRAAHPALRRGRRQTVATTSDLWVYSMTTAGDTVYVAINRGDNDQTASGLPSGSLKELVEDATVNGPTLTIPARQTRIFVTP